MTERLHVVVRGRVQGVGFRYAAYRKAQELGLAGWVRNLGDGSVEAELDGARALLEAFLAWCREGPPLARVQTVDVTWSVPRFSHTEVEIR
ncbi:MAG: acylphosphatase [Candidatus Hydrogenedentes bacterium]|nr:acylphosphatase [Candidatus Hydrogenedentota bacterium]